MNRYQSYLSNAVTIIGTYKKDKPFSYHIKDFFSGQKKFGSRDRKQIASLCYYYFRVVHAFPALPVDEVIRRGIFLCEEQSSELLGTLQPEWNEKAGYSPDEKLKWLGISADDLFPFKESLSKELDPAKFSLSFLQQPDLFIRVRPARVQQVMQKLNASSIPFTEAGTYCLRLIKNTSVESIVQPNREVVIQDYNSQRVFCFLDHNPELLHVTNTITVWDCCAASGGKSILLYDTLKGKIKLTVSDIRESILSNLVKRMQEAGININRKFVCDLTTTKPPTADERYSVIVCDVPCSGSGTWSRTPEQLSICKREEIAIYSDRQKKIASTAIQYLHKNGLFFYITCSVFSSENEEVVHYLKEKFHLQLLQMEYLKGYELKADTMFVAVFTV
ncbi:MAG: Fmu (Sun) domain-containing protein [Bacteroidetes bacterium]|nr:Fmu (Sun) domain-containing protein [Bacteroidota bacterium]